MPILTRGQSIPDLDLLDLSGHRIHLAAELASGPVLLYFFKSGCAASHIAAPFVEHISQGYAEHLSAEGTRLKVFAVAQDDEPSAREFSKRHQLSFPLLLDAELVASRACELDATPTLVLLRGRERLRMDADSVPESRDFEIADVVVGWSRADYELCSEEIAARIGGLPPELPELPLGVPATKPG